MDQDPNRRLKLLLVGLIIDGQDVGGTYSAYRWVEALGRVADVTLLCLERPGRPSVASQLPHIRVVSWPEPKVLARFERLRAMAKPAWPVFCGHVRRWIGEALVRGEHFDFAHQLMPQAMRFRSPLRHFDIPYGMGPLDGSLLTPAPLAQEVSRWPFANWVRRIDAAKPYWDPGLRQSFERAEIVFGVAPYVAEKLSGLAIKRFALALERGFEGAEPATRTPHVRGALKLLHVGRGVRTKGLRDAVRAMALLADRPGITLTSAGFGPEIAACKAEAEALGLGDRVTFLGRVSREEVDQLYASHDVFCFPTFREPMGGVLFEAFGSGLPIIAANYGGPQAIIDDSCGVLIDIAPPQAFAAAIADAVRALDDSPERVVALSKGALARLEGFGTWDQKAAAMVATFRAILDSSSLPAFGQAADESDQPRLAAAAQALGVKDGLNL